MAEAFDGLDKVESGSGAKEKKKKDKEREKNKDSELNKEIAKEVAKEHKKDKDKPETKLNNEEVLDEKVELVKRIQRYNNDRFGKFLKDAGINFGDDYLRKQDIDGLKWHLKKIDALLATKNNSSLIDKSIKGALEFMEGKIHESSKYKIRGAVNKCWTDDVFLDNYERLKLRYGLDNIIGTDPITVCSISLMNAAIMMHNLNTLKTDTDLSRPIDISDISGSGAETSATKPSGDDDGDPDVVDLDGPAPAGSRVNNLE